MTTFTETWNAAYEADPADTDAASGGATDIRSVKKAVRERLAVDHSLAGDAADGAHNKLTMPEQGSDPSNVANTGFLYTKEANSKTELFFRDEDGNIIQLTSGGLISGAERVGDVKMVAHTDEEFGWLNCDGAAISRSTYATLFAKIGTTYGVGNGSTTFNVPDFKGRSPMGVGQGAATGEGDTTGTDRTLGDKAGYETHTLTVDEMPAHTHTAVTLLGSTEGGGGDNKPVTGNTGSTGGDGAHNNVGPSLVVNFQIFTGVVV